MHLIPERRPGRSGRLSGSCSALLNRSRLQPPLNIDFEMIVVEVGGGLALSVVLRVLAHVLAICLVNYRHELISAILIFAFFRRVTIFALGCALQTLLLTILLFLPLRNGELELLARHLLLGSAFLEGVEDVLDVTLLAHEQRLGERARCEHVD